MPDRPESSTRALAWLYSPAAQRAPLATLCAIELEIGASLRRGLDHQVAHTRLAWWAEECARCALGRPLHPLTRELTALLAPAGAAPVGGLDGLVDAAVWDLASAPFETRRELSGYCERWSGAMIEPLARQAAPAVPGEQARMLGAKLRELELLVALAPDARSGRLRLPLEELDRAQIPPESLAQPPFASALVSLLRERHRELRTALAASVNALPCAAQAPLRGLIVWAAIACAQSVRAQARLPRASLTRDHHAPLDGWRAWRAARRAQTGRGLARAA